MAGQYVITVHVDTRWARRWVRLMDLISPIVGIERATDWAVRGVYRLIRTRIA